MSATYNPGYEVSPTIYLIGPDGKILWSDHQARPRHQKAEKAMLFDLEAAIQQELEKVLGKKVAYAGPGIF
jgi:hypothetical protein